MRFSWKGELRLFWIVLKMQFWCAENTVLERSIVCWKFVRPEIIVRAYCDSYLVVFLGVSTIYSKRRNWLFSCFILIRRPKAILPRSATSPDRPPLKYSSPNVLKCDRHPVHMYFVIFRTPVLSGHPPTLIEPSQVLRERIYAKTYTKSLAVGHEGVESIGTVYA